MTDTPPKPKCRRWRWLVVPATVVLSAVVITCSWFLRPRYGAENDARMKVDFGGLPRQFGWVIAVEMADGTIHTPIQRGPGIVYWDFFGRAHEADDCAQRVIRDSGATLFTGVEEAQYPSSAKRLVVGWYEWTKPRGEPPQKGPWHFVAVDPSRVHSVSVGDLPDGALSKPQEEALLAAAEIADKAVEAETNLRRHGSVK